MVHAVAATTMPGRRSSSRRAPMSTRMKEMQSSRKIASVTKGFNSSPAGGTATPMNTSAAIARVP